MLLAMLLLTAYGRAEIIDRIAVTVGKQVITMAQIETEIRVTAFLAESKPELTDLRRREAAGRLIDQTLVRREMEITRFPAPKPADAGPLMERAKAIHGDGYANALREAGLTEEDLTQHLLWQLTLMRFVQYRFQPGISVSDTEVRELYNEQSAKLKAQGKETPPFEAARKDLEAVLMQRYVDKALEKWLVEQREQMPVVVKVKGLEQ
jgi:hypothetical protein